MYLNWNSLTARRYKVGLIRCLADRIWKLVSNTDERLREVNKRKTILVKNEYPSNVVEQALNRFLERKARHEDPKMYGPDKLKCFITLPLLNIECEEYAVRLKRLVENSFPQVNFNVAFQTPMTIGKLFPFKDRIKLVEEMSSVVYCLKCKTCGKKYIGKTERILYYRIKEHRSESKSNKSACREHILDNEGHEIDFDGIEVLDSADNGTKLAAKELLHILRHKPELNKQRGSQSSSEIKTIIIQPYPDQ